MRDNKNLRTLYESAQITTDDYTAALWFQTVYDDAINPDETLRLQSLEKLGEFRANVGKDFYNLMVGVLGLRCSYSAIGRVLQKSHHTARKRFRKALWIFSKIYSIDSSRSNSTNYINHGEEKHYES